MEPDGQQTLKYIGVQDKNLNNKQTDEQFIKK